MLPYLIKNKYIKFYGDFMKKQMWISRLTLNSGGTAGTCSIIDRKKMKEEILEFKNTVDPIEVDLNDDETQYETITIPSLVEELNNGRLRQGWGLKFENLDTDFREKNEEDWTKNYIKLRWRIFSEDMKCDEACGRYNILKKMLDMNRGDIIFIPKIPFDGYFTVATVTKGYEFKERKKWINFGHVINVEKVRSFKHNETLSKSVFYPYRRAVNKIESKKYHSMLSDFLDDYYI